MKDISSIDYNKEYIGNITDVKEYNQMWIALKTK
jgi:hypothetical protein